MSDSDEEPVSDLEFTTLDELIAEIRKRFPCFIVAVAGDSRDGKSLNWSLHVNYAQVLATLGLAHVVIGSLQRSATGTPVDHNAWEGQEPPETAEA